MKNLSLKIDINAPREKVWAVLWNDDTYRKWTSVFMEGSYAVSDWKEGSKILFLSPSGEGMFSMIAKKIPNEVMAFKHLGTVKDGKEQPDTKETKDWAGALETYTLRQTGNATELAVSMDVTEEHESYFRETFPKALEKVKVLAEERQ